MKKSVQLVSIFSFFLPRMLRLRQKTSLMKKLFLFLLGGIWRWIGIGFVSRGKEAFCLLKRRYKAADKSAKNIAIIAAKEPRFACPKTFCLWMRSAFLGRARACLGAGRADDRQRERRSHSNDNRPDRDDFLWRRLVGLGLPSAPSDAGKRSGLLLLAPFAPRPSVAGF